MFKFMLLVDQIRGKHSTGVLSVNYNTEVQVLKKAIHSSDFLDLGTTQSLINQEAKMLLGHNRHATVGAITSENAHPFEHDNIIGVHNGTLRNQALLPDSKDFKVDSNNIYHSINKIGIKQTAMKLNGAYALVWYDTDKDRLYMYRNEERPLCYAFSDDGKQVYWASEDWMLMVAARKAGVKIRAVQKLPVHELLTVDLKGFKRTGADIYDRTSIREVPAYEPPKYPVTFNGSSGGRYNNSTYNGSYVDTKQFVLDTVVKSAHGNGGTYYGYNEDGEQVEVEFFASSSSLQFDTILIGTSYNTTWKSGKRTISYMAYNVREVHSNPRMEVEGRNPKESKKNKGGAVEKKHKAECTGGGSKDQQRSLPTTSKSKQDHRVAWAGSYITKEEFSRLISLGCAWCLESNVDATEITPLSDKTFVCDCCMELTDVIDYVEQDRKHANH